MEVFKCLSKSFTISCNLFKYIFINRDSNILIVTNLYTIQRLYIFL